MREAAAVLAHKSAHAAEVESCGHRREQLVRDHDGPARDLKLLLFVDERGEHPAADVADVRRPLAQIRVGDVVEGAGEPLDNLGHRALHVDSLVAHQRSDLLAKSRIPHHQRLRRKDIALARADAVIDRFLERQEVLLGLAQRRVEPGQLAAHLVGRNLAP